MEGHRFDYENSKMSLSTGTGSTVNSMYLGGTATKKKTFKLTYRWLSNRILHKPNSISCQWFTVNCKLHTWRRTSWRSRMLALVEYNTFLITSLASCKYSLLRAGLNLLGSVPAKGEPGSLLSVDDIDTTDWLTFDDSEALSVLLNLTVKATNHRRTDSLALVIKGVRASDSLSAVLDLLCGTCATVR